MAAAEDAATTDLEERIRNRSRRATACGVCEWLRDREDAAFWNRMMALTVKEASHRAIHEEIVQLGYPSGENTVGNHRRNRHG